MTTTHIHRFASSLVTTATLSMVPFLSSCAAGEGEEDYSGEIGQATFELRQVPSTNVTCIRISVVGTTTVTKDYGNLLPGAGTTTLNMDRLPVGTVSISAQAYAASTSATACNATAAPTYIADAMTALLEPGVVSTLDLTFRKNNPVVASANFVGNIQAISAAYYHTLLLVDGQVYFWGATSAFTPTLVPGLTEVVAISAGYNFSCALKGDGSIWCWGASATVGVTSATPVQMAAGRTYSAVHAGNASICGISAGTAYCWGSTFYGRLGVNPTTTSVVPMASPQTVAQVASLQSATTHTCYVTNYLDVTCAGRNYTGGLGRATSTVDTHAWSSADQSSPAVQVAVGEGFTLILMDNGTVRGAGTNDDGQAGLGTAASATYSTAPGPAQVAGLTAVEAIAAGNSHSLALRTDGGVKAFGSNGQGQLGDSSTTDRTTPTTVVELPPARLIAAGGYHSCAVTRDERVYCWGNNQYGQLGMGDKINTASPKQVVLP